MPFELRIKPGEWSGSRGSEGERMIYNWGTEISQLAVKSFSGTQESDF